MATKKKIPPVNKPTKAKKAKKAPTQKQIDREFEQKKKLAAKARAKARALADKAPPGKKRVQLAKGKKEADKILAAARAKVRRQKAQVRTAAKDEREYQEKRARRQAQLDRHQRVIEQAATRTHTPPVKKPPKLKTTKGAKKGSAALPPGVVHKRRVIEGPRPYTPKDWTATTHGMAPRVLRGLERQTPMIALAMAMIEPGLTTQEDAAEFARVRADLERGELHEIIEASVDRDGLIVVSAGSHAILAARELGIELLPVAWKRYAGSLANTDAAHTWPRLGAHPPLPGLLPAGVVLTTLTPPPAHGEPGPPAVAPVGFFPDADKMLLDMRRELEAVERMVQWSHPKLSASVAVVANDDGTIDGQVTIRIPDDDMGNAIYGIDDVVTMILDCNMILDVPEGAMISTMLGFRTNLDILEIIKKGYIFNRDVGLAMTPIYWQGHSRQNQQFATASQVAQSIAETDGHEVPSYLAIRLYWAADGEKPSRFR